MTILVLGTRPTNLLILISRSVLHISIVPHTSAPVLSPPANYRQLSATSHPRGDPADVVFYPAEKNLSYSFHPLRPELVQRARVVTRLVLCTSGRVLLILATTEEFCSTPRQLCHDCGLWSSLRRARHPMFASEDYNVRHWFLLAEIGHFLILL